MVVYIQILFSKIERSKLDLFNELKKLKNGQELTSGDHFEFNEKKMKKMKKWHVWDSNPGKKKSIDVPRGLPYTVNTAASVNV